MKRVLICVCLLVFTVLASVYSWYRVERVEKDIANHVEALGQVMVGGNRDELAMRSTEFAAYWDKEEDVLIHFVRHSHIDLITTSVARLPSLAAYDDLGEFSAELANIRRQMEHIRGSEEITLSNIF